MDDFFRSQQSPRGESHVSGAFVSPPRNGPLLPRRFTTDSGRVPTLSSITTIPRAAEPQDFASTTVRLWALGREWREGGRGCRGWDLGRLYALFCAFKNVQLTFFATGSS